MKCLALQPLENLGGREQTLKTYVRSHWLSSSPLQCIPATLQHGFSHHSTPGRLLPQKGSLCTSPGFVVPRLLAGVSRMRERTCICHFSGVINYFFHGSNVRDSHLLQECTHYHLYPIKAGFMAQTGQYCKGPCSLLVSSCFDKAGECSPSWVQLSFSSLGFSMK